MIDTLVTDHRILAEHNTIMKHIFTTLFLAVTFSSSAQEFVYDTISHGGLERDFILYVPDSYTPGTPAPLVLNFHGYSSNAGQQMFYGAFSTQADAAGFLVVHPNGTLDAQNITHWNANWGSTVDDVGFTSAMIDSLAAEYSIDLDRVYSTGMSNGGFFSYYLACELGNRIAAIASVTGTMTVGTMATCDPTHPMPVMEIHGTADPTVPYNGQSGFMEPIPDVIDHWVGYNNCDPSATVTNVPDSDPNDGCTAIHHHYPNGDDGVDVEHYEIVGGGHTWPDAILDIGVTNRDFNGSQVIWEFFNQYDINGRRPGVGIIEAEKAIQVTVQPNPVVDQLTVTIKGEGENAFQTDLISSTGVVVSSNSVRNSKSTILDLSKHASGIYILKVTTDSNVELTRVLKL